MKQKAGIVIDETDLSDKSDQEDEASADKENVALFNSKVIDHTIKEVDQFKIKFIKFTNRYFFCRRNPSDRLLRYFTGKQFGLVVWDMLSSNLVHVLSIPCAMSFIR